MILAWGETPDGEEFEPGFFQLGVNVQRGE